MNIHFFLQAAYDEDEKARKNSKENEDDYHETLFVEPFEQKPSLDVINEPETLDENVADEAESIASDEEELLAVKKSTNHKVFKGNSDTQKRLTRSADLKKPESTGQSEQGKLPILTKVNIQNVPKGITITKTKKVIAITKPNATATKKTADAEVKSKKITPNSSPDSKPSGSQKLPIVKGKTEVKELPPKKPTAETINKRPDVQKVKLTKAQVAAMAKEGKIAVKDGQVFLRNAVNKNAKQN